MGVSRCRVSYLDQEGLDHSVEVEAESLYEAVATAVAEFRQGEIITDTPGPMTEFCVTVLRKPIEHRELSARLPKSGPNLAKRYAEPVWVRPPAGFTRMKSLSHLM